MNRRGFMGSILALGVAPAIVRADSLMRIVPRDVGILRVRNPLFGGEVGRYNGVILSMRAAYAELEPPIWQTEARMAWQRRLNRAISDAYDVGVFQP